jgi:chromosome segregation ATPase
MRIYQLSHRSSAWPEAVARAAEIDKWKKEHRERFSKGFDKTKEAAELNAQITELNKQMAVQQEKLRQFQKEHPREAPPPPEPSAKVVELDKRIEELNAGIGEIQKQVKQAEEAAGAEAAALPETKADQQEIARLKAQIEPLKPQAEALLKEALAEQDERRKMAQEATEETRNYLLGYWRATTPIKASLGGWWHHRTRETKQRLKTENETYGKWAALTDRLAELEARCRYRAESRLVRHAGRAALLIKVDALQAELNDLKNERKAAMPEASPPPPIPAEEAALQDKLAALKEKHGKLRGQLKGDRQKYVQDKMREAGVVEMDKERKSVLTEGREKAMRPYYQEDIAIWCTLRSAFHGWFNGPYGKYTPRYCAKLVGEQRVRGNLAQGEMIARDYAPENWRTSVDQWDWRTKWEKDGSIEELPLTKKWLERVGQRK